MDKYRVTLTSEERTDLEQLVSCGQAAARKLIHARILLLADDSRGEERPDEQIVSSPGISLRTASRVRQQLVTEGLDVALLRRRQPPRPDKIKIKGDVEQRLVELACSDPPLGRCHWTLQLLADEMVDVIQTYMLPYDPLYPVVCFDEACKQLFGEVRTPRRRRGRAQVDYEYERKGVCHQLMMCEPLRGWRHVRVSARRTRKDYALCVQELVDEHYPQAKKIKMVQDNLNTHDGASLYEAFAPAEARRLLDKIEWHYTPKHGSWVNMAETEIGIMNGQCLDRRQDSQQKIATEVAGWESKRNAQEARIHWTFTLAVARQKLRKLYPSNED
jgi:hypothetical protein